jgi:hypothetical protein
MEDVSALWLPYLQIPILTDWLAYNNLCRSTGIRDISQRHKKL